MENRATQNKTRQLVPIGEFVVAGFNGRSLLSSFGVLGLNLVIGLITAGLIALAFGPVNALYALPFVIGFMLVIEKAAVSRFLENLDTTDKAATPVIPDPGAGTRNQYVE